MAKNKVTPEGAIRQTLEQDHKVTGIEMVARTGNKMVVHIAHGHPTPKVPGGSIGGKKVVFKSSPKRLG